MKLLDETAKHGPIPPSHWLLSVASYPRHSQDSDPQRGWYAAHMNICEFLQSVPAAQQMQVRGEDVLTDPDPSLHCIAEWLGLRTDTEALEAMKHPERSPYAGFGPPGARYGNDPFFLSNPALRTVHAASQSLEGPLSWRDDGREFLPRVKRLAQQFGYQ